MSGQPSKWDDLAPRIVSGAILAVIGVAAMAAGGLWFTGLVAVASGIMIWELARMMSPADALAAAGLGIVAGLAVLSVRWLGAWALVPLLVPAALGWRVMPPDRPSDRPVWAAFAVAVALAGYGLITFRDTYGTVWLFWLVLVVIATDISGYFAGRALGGPKFWPRISPKKTWSGTVAGWVSAAIVGAVFLLFTDAGRDLVWISACVAFASQMGDISESAIKRRSGVKDSSNLIPGHGGLFDRFDGLLGASLAMLVVALLVDVPQVRF